MASEKKVLIRCPSTWPNGENQERVSIEFKEESLSLLSYFRQLRSYEEKGDMKVYDIPYSRVTMHIIRTFLEEDDEKLQDTLNDGYFGTCLHEVIEFIEENTSKLEVSKYFKDYCTLVLNLNEYFDMDLTNHPYIHINKEEVSRVLLKYNLRKN